MPIINQIFKFANTISDVRPQQRKCPCCFKFGAHKHGSFPRYLLGQNTIYQIIWIQRFICLSCLKTFSYLPFCYLRRTNIALPDILQLSSSSFSWATLEEIYEISRKTLWRWRQTGKKMLKFLPELLSLSGFSWRILSTLLSQLQYPYYKPEPSPTVADN